MQKILGIKPIDPVSFGPRIENLYIPLIKGNGITYDFTEAKEGIYVYSEKENRTSLIPWTNIACVDVENFPKAPKKAP